MRSISLGLCLCLLLFGENAAGQAHSTPINHADYHQSSRADIQQSGDSSIHTSLKPYNINISVHESLLFEKPVFRSFYKNGKDLYQLESSGIEFRINPVFNIQYGNEENASEARYINSRGAELKGTIDKKIGYYVMVTDNQIQFPSDVQDRITEYEAIPREGFYKDFKSSTAADFISTRAYINVPISKHIRINFGHDRHFIGNGHRSLLLSDHSSPYLFLRLNTKVWKLNYQNLFVELNGQVPRSIGDTLRPKKFAAFHHLSLNLTRNFNIGVFEGVVFARNNLYELQYLNPIMFYRSVEQSLGSPDNAFIGFDAKYNFLKHFSIYGQLVIDEFNFQQIKDSTGWWGNKFGYQLGLKYIDVAGLKGLDLQAEFNTVRPYTYTHIDGRANYTHYNQALAHPMGANFNEYIGIIRYQLGPKWNFQGKYILVNKGVDNSDSKWQNWSDSTSSNWGGNIFLPYTSREQEYNNSTFQGQHAKLQIIDMALSYQWRHNIFLDLLYRNRFYNNPVGPNQSSSYAGFGLRMNIAERRLDY